MSRKPKDPCKANACKIQACLSANHYQESKCLDVLEQMRLCCVKWHKESLCCSGIDIERRYLQVVSSEATEVDRKSEDSKKSQLKVNIHE